MAKRKTNIFEQAARLKLRIGTEIGKLSVEDLWDLPLQSKSGQVNLDDIARGFSAKLKDQATESFVEKPARKDPTSQLCFDIVKHVIDVRLAENEAARTAEKKRQLKLKIAGIIADKENEELRSQSLEELQAQLADL